ncbi:uncharacterized protein LOC130655615 [Hydractinia symbiolongicarpus]|uniref:uncharacterized protein LOC130655615 n=1 Tax=Hydractinia symbiolongicarpus TaxID=13093 RepID=UPI00254D123C|nr:uncharacterized protein LOC130655615 [Hydractinia symbiolongicarpus]
MLVYQPDYNTVGFVNILSAVAAAWPVILIAVLLATIMGWILWFADQTAEESDLTQERAIYGAYEGFWCSFITMTTLGYGDYVPSSNLGKGLMIIWILTGLCVVSIFGGAVSSGMSVSSLEKSYKLYGAKVAAIKNSFEYRTAILRNAILDDTRNYTSVLDVIDAVSRQEVEIGLIDAVTTKGYEKRLSDMNVKIYKILDLNSGYGVVLSGEFKRVETDVRSFVSSNQAEISLFVQRKIGLLQPQLLDVEEMLLTPEESTSLVLNMIIAYLILSCVCVIIWYGWRTYRSRRKIAPMEHSLARHRDIVGCNEIGEEFSKSFREKLAELDEKHTHEKFELFVLKRSYSRHLRRMGKVPEEVQNKPTKKRKKALRKYVLDS